MVDVARLVVEGQGTFVRVRRPIYWVYVACVGFGLLSVGRSLQGAFIEISTALWAAAALNGALAAVFILLLARMDLFEREPAALRAAAFLWGALAATSFAVIANDSALSLIAKSAGTEFAVRWGPALAAPINEEWLKTLGVVILALIAGEHFHRPMDGLIYGAMCGLGFQVVENMIYAVNNALTNPDSDLSGAVWVTVVRILVAGPWSHAVYSGVAGLGIAYAVTRVRRPRWLRYGVAAGLFAVACGMHFLWNSPLPSDLPSALALPVLYGKGVVILLFFVALYIYAQRREWRWFTTTMSDQPESVITTDELTSMRSLHSRRVARKVAGMRYGPAGRKLVNRMQVAQVNLGEALAHVQRPGATRAEELAVTVALTNVANIRRRLEALRPRYGAMRQN